MVAHPDWSMVQQAYDELAPTYDRIPLENRINAYMRRVSLSRLLSVFPEGAHLLELGCGTGEEALALGERGRDVVALDTSLEMIRRGQAHAQDRGLSNRVKFLQLRARDLKRLDSPPGSFDGAYASFSLGYEPDLAAMSTPLFGLLRSDAPVLISLPSRLCLIELVLAVALGRPGVAGRRLRPWFEHKVGRWRVPLRSFTPESLRWCLAPQFRLVRFEALPFLVPPPYMNRAYARWPGLADALEAADQHLRSRFPFRYLGDHIFAEFQRAT